MLRYFLICIAFSSVYSVAESPDNAFSPLMCIDHYPPLQIIHKDGHVTGENVEIARTFFRKAGFELKFTENVPFKRCLQWLKEGKVDVVAGLIHTPERELEFNLYRYDEVTIKAFYINKESLDIKSFTDLKGKRVAVVRGVKNFEKFDNAKRHQLIKVPVDTLQNGFGILAKNRVDAVIATDFYGDHILRNNNDLGSQLKKTSYQVQSGTETFIAVSKLSPLNQEHERLLELSNSMYKSGQFKQMVEQFQSDNSELY